MRSTMSRNSNERRKQGFTLMEMLIVVAVIAVLIAVAIPVFSSSLHKSRVATDWANFTLLLRTTAIRANDRNNS